MYGSIMSRVLSTYVTWFTWVFPLILVMSSSMFLNVEANSHISDGLSFEKSRTTVYVKSYTILSLEFGELMNPFKVSNRKLGPP
jgi:hypothetical protein